MPEPGFREIQLNTKQVVFLFMACVVAAVAIFLLGVSVGRNVTSTSAAEQTATPDPAAERTVTGVMPPATSPKPGELKYHDELLGKGETKPAAPPDTPAAPAATPSPTPAPAKPSPSPVAKPSPTPVKPAPSPAPPAATQKPPAGELYVQVNSFESRANADGQASQLKAKGFAAFVFTAPSGSARFKVRIGPFADRAAADAMMTRLRREGLQPSVIR